MKRTWRFRFGCTDFSTQHSVLSVQFLGVKWQESPTGALILPLGSVHLLRSVQRLVSHTELDEDIKNLEHGLHRHYSARNMRTLGNRAMAKRAVWTLCQARIPTFVMRVT